MCFRNSERISGHKTVMNAEWVCRAEVSITRWKIINTSFGEFHNIWAAANSKQLKSSLDLILRGKTPWELLFVCWNWSLMTLWISEKRRRRLQSVKSKQFSWKNEWHFPNIKVKTNTCYTTWRRKSSQENAYLCQPKIENILGECSYICWNIDSP